MYQTAVTSDTRLSRIDGPVCITRLAMRPAKSFWKKLHDWRTTCQWLCQRTRLATLAAIAWLDSTFCSVCDAGRNTRSTVAIASSSGQNVANRFSRGRMLRGVRRPTGTVLVPAADESAGPASCRAGSRIRVRYARHADARSVQPQGPRDLERHARLLGEFCK